MELNIQDSTNLAAELNGYFLGATQSGCISASDGGSSYLSSVLCLLIQGIKKMSVGDESIDGMNENDWRATLKRISGSVVSDCNSLQTDRLACACVSSAMESSGCNGNQLDNQTVQSIVFRNGWVADDNKVASSSAAAPLLTGTLDLLRTSDLGISKFQIIPM